MNQAISENFEIFGKDLNNAGKVSTKIKARLKDIGINPSIIRRVGIICYESEMNIVMYADRGTMKLKITPEKIDILAEDEGQGIEDIDLAMQEGYSTATDEMRQLGFGAGMGLPNIKKNADKFDIQSERGKGTRLAVEINIT